MPSKKRSRRPQYDLRDLGINKDTLDNIDAAIGRLMNQHGLMCVNFSHELAIEWAHNMLRDNYNQFPAEFRRGRDLGSAIRILYGRCKIQQEH